MRAIVEKRVDIQASATPPKSRYRPEIDGLRAFAIVAVIINHFNKDLLQSGYLGVDTFFVISGYVITSSLADRESKNFQDFLTGFYERRIKRLVPALVVFVLVTSLLICFFNPIPGLALKTGMTSLFGLSNLYLFQKSTDYFAASTELNPFTHTWSLGVEEQFYLLFPFLIWFSGFGRKAKNGARNLFVWIGALSVISLTGFIVLYQSNQPAAYFLMPLRFWEMAAGCLIFIGFQKRVKIEQRLEQIPPLLVVTIVVGVMFLPVSAAVPATISVVLLSAILIACLKQGTGTYKFFTLEKVVYIGRISYSLYLWHWAVLSISRWTIGIDWWSIPLQIGVMLLISVLSYQHIELPLRKKSWFAKRWHTLIFSLVLLFFALATGKALNKFSGSLFAGNVQKDESIFSGEMYWKSEKCNNDRQLQGIPTYQDFEGCWFYPRKGSRAEKIASKTIYAYGDSYNMQLAPAYYALLLKDSDIRVNAYASTGCPSSRRIQFSGEKDLGHCSRVFEKYLHWFLRESKKGDILILANSPHYFFTSNEFQFFVHRNRIDSSGLLQEYMDELKGLAMELEHNERRLLVVSAIPTLTAEPNTCHQWYTALNRQCSMRNLFNRKRVRETSRINRHLKKELRNSPGAINIYDEVKNVASKSLNPFVFYRDSAHLSPRGALETVDVMRRSIYSGEDMK